MKDLLSYTVRWAKRSEVLKLPQIEQAAAELFAPYLAPLELAPELMVDIATVGYLLQAQADRRLWVAVLDGPYSLESLIGFLVARPLSASFFIVEIDVLPAYGRRGVGSALMHTACEAAAAQGFDTVTLTTFRQVPWNIPFYQQLGFDVIAPGEWDEELAAIVEHEERYGFKRQHRAVMQRRLR